jgi:cation diffusion facilitator CzcD-associated flavoprotein CzcO/predicted ATP-grasp superfamily ATP-dependent carboligase
VTPRSARRVLLTDGEDRSVLAACRGLRAGGFEVDVVGGARPAPTHWSRACGDRVHLPHPLVDERSFVDGLEQAVRRRGYSLLLPGSDASLLAVSAHRSRLEPHTRVGLPSHEIVLAATSKTVLTEAAVAAGFVEPETVVCAGVPSALAAARRLGFPVVLKPVRSVVSFGGRMEHHGSTTVVDEQALEAMARVYGDPCLVQAHETGPVTSFAGVLADGGLLATAVSRYQRTWLPTAGNACYSTSIDPPRGLAEAVSDLVVRLGWQGIFELELIERPDGSFVPIDFNPRVYGSLALALRAGANIPAVWCDWALGGRPLPVRARPGVSYRWEDADLRHFLFQLRRGQVAAAMKVLRLRRGTAHPHFELADPAPLAARALLLARRAWTNARARPQRDSETQRRRHLGRRRRRPGEVAIIGAGPYGLSAAAYLCHASVPVRVFGEPFEFWHKQMPEGMILRSRKRSTHIADPERKLTIDHYEAAQNVTVSTPSLTLEEFLAYGAWYQRHAVGDVDRRRVRRVERDDGAFGLELDDGERMTAERVVVAAGLSPFGNRPKPWASLPESLVHHSVDLHDLRGFAGKRVFVVGGGQSAIESAALLSEAGADVEVATRAPGVLWLTGDDPGERVPLRMRTAPPTDVGSFFSGWPAAAPDLYRRLPAPARMAVSWRCLRPRASGWLRPRLADVRVQIGRWAVAAESVEDTVRVMLDDGSERIVDRVVLGTGYRVDVARYPFIAPELAGAIDIVDGYPRLGAGLESSVPGLHFLGAPASMSFGPIVRFVVGTWYTAPALTQRVLGRKQPPLRFAFR